MILLICDKIHPKTLEILKHNSIPFDYLPEITSQELLNKISIYVGLIVRSRTKVTKEVIAKGTKLKIIGRVGSGLDNIHLESAKKNNITVINAPGANAQAVAEHTLILMLNLLHPVQEANKSMHEGLWLKKELKGHELFGKTVGIVGYGHIGKKVESLVRAFGAHPLIHSRSFQTASLTEVFEKSDIVSIHLSLNPDTKGIINNKLLQLMKSTAYFINCSRGEIVDENALFDSVSNGKIAGAALDVFWQEPLPADSRWRKLTNVVLTPHIGASTSEAFERASVEVAIKIIAILKEVQS